jgi:hypothetical protein
MADNGELQRANFEKSKAKIDAEIRVPHLWNVETPHWDSTAPCRQRFHK